MKVTSLGLAGWILMGAVAASASEVEMDKNWAEVIQWAEESRDAEATGLVSPTFWHDVSDLIVNCAALSVSRDEAGRAIVGNLVATCDAIELNGHMARFDLNGVSYYAVLNESVHSDGGDLNDLQVLDDSGSLFATKDAVASFGDVLLALAGNRDDFRVVDGK